MTSIPTTLHRLALAVAVGLACPVAALAAVPATTLVTFGETPPAATPPAYAGAAAVPAARLSADDVRDLADLAPGRALSVLDAAALPLPPDESATLRGLFDGGVPVLLHTRDASPDALLRVTELFGIAPTAGDVVVRRDGAGATTVYAADHHADVDVLLTAALSATRSTVEAPEADTLFTARGAELDTATEPGPLLPARHFDVNFVDAAGEVSGVTGIDLVRSRTASTDSKYIVLTSKATIKTALNGITEGSVTGQNLWATYLPVEYRLRHAIDTGDVTPTYIDHFPETDGRTEFTQTDTKIRGFTIGGSTGSELSSTGAADATLASKVPLNVNFGYEHKWQTAVTTTFRDYSLLATPEANRAVVWKALIAPRLQNVLVKRWGADMPTLTLDYMTPMMRSTTLVGMSQWKLPGSYEGMATLEMSGGYSLERNEWRYKRVDIVHTKATDSRDVPTRFVVDMSDPYLSAEITVQIRSHVGSGSCMTDDGIVRLAACDSSDRRQLWGLDASNRYVNRASGRCLAVQPSSGNVVTESCANITFEKQWQWRADRLHSLANPARYRLYVENGQVRFDAAAGRFQDYPVNPFGPQLDPWSNYPQPPLPGSQQPAPAGVRPVDIDPTWTSYAPVSDDQRWRVEVLRLGL